MRDGEPNGDYFWLRQSVTFTADGQTRTLEIAVPVRLGASQAEVDALLAQATAGMTQLSSALDARVAAALAPGASSSSFSAGPAAAPSPERTATPATPVAMAASAGPTENERAERAAVPPATAREPAPMRQAVARPTTPAPASSPDATVPPRSTPSAAPAEPTVVPIAQSSVPSSVPPTAPAASGREIGPLTPTPPTPATTGPELSRPEFLAAVGQLGLKPKEAMDRLGVRSLEGLNLREALEALRRQMLRGSTAPTAPIAHTPAPAQVAPTRTSPARAESSRTSAGAPVSAKAPTYFDEEDESADFTFTVDDEGAVDDTGVPDEPLYGPDDEDLDDVPDFGPPPGRASSPPAASRARPRGESAHPAPAEPTAAPPPNPEEARAAELIAEMRAASPGGTASSQQRTAYRNIIVAELGEASARALIQSLWRVTPDRLGPDQYDELISWGKQDTFADDVPLVLAALDAERRAERERAERERAERGSAGAAGSNGSAARAASSTAAPPSTSRPKPTRPGTSGQARGES